MRTWLNGRVPERHSGDVGSTPAVRTNSRAQSRACDHRVWIADPMIAPPESADRLDRDQLQAPFARRCGFGRRPFATGTIAQFGRAPALQAGDAGSSPARFHHWRGRLEPTSTSRVEVLIGAPSAPDCEEGLNV